MNPVVVTVPNGLGSVEVLVRDQDWGVEVDVRPAGTQMRWTPIELMGGKFEVREQ